MTGAGTTVDEARYLPFLEGPRTLDQESFRWRLGVRELDLRDWIELGPDADAAIAAKPRLNAEHRSTVFAALDGVEQESQQVADTLFDHVRRRWPDRYAGTVLDPALHPLDAAARLVPEDLVLMVERDGRLVFGAGSVCFPNRWDLRSKIGLPLADVHAPVALLNEQLQGPIDRFFERLTPERSFWRLGWGVLDTADWYTPTDGTAARRPAPPDTTTPDTTTPDTTGLSDAERDPAGLDPADLFLRVERETIRRFEGSKAVLFTIRTYVTPIPAVAGTPATRHRLADALAGLPDPVQAYKDVASFGPALIAHLRVASTSQVDTM